MADDRVWKELDNMRGRLHDMANRVTEVLLRTHTCEKFAEMANEQAKEIALMGKDLATAKADLETLKRLEHARSNRIVMLVSIAVAVVTLIVNVIFKLFGK